MSLCQHLCFLCHVCVMQSRISQSVVGDEQILRELEGTWGQEKETTEYGDCMAGVYSKAYPLQQWIQVGNRQDQPQYSRMPNQLGQARPERVNAKTSLLKIFRNLGSPQRGSYQNEREKGCNLLRLNPEATEIIPERHWLKLGD